MERIAGKADVDAEVEAIARVKARNTQTWVAPALGLTAVHSLERPIRDALTEGAVAIDDGRQRLFMRRENLLTHRSCALALSVLVAVVDERTHRACEDEPAPRKLGQVARTRLVLGLHRRGLQHARRVVYRARLFA